MPETEEKVFAPTKENVDPRADRLLAQVVISGEFEKLEQFSIKDLKRGRWTSVLLLACLWTNQTGRELGYLNTICGHAIRIMMHQKFYGEEITAVLQWFLGKTVSIENIVKDA